MPRSAGVPDLAVPAARRPCYPRGMNWRPYEPERDRQAAHRIWYEVGWLRLERPEVFEVAAATRPSWDLAYWGGAQVFSRGGQLGCRRAERLAGQLSRFGWRDEEVHQLLRACAAGRSD